MNPKVNIIALVDVIGALSDSGLEHGHLCMVDDSAQESTGQGTAQLCTLVQPGQVVEWTALAVDVQTPLVIKNIAFLAPDGSAVPVPPAPPVPFAPATGPDADGSGADSGQENPDALVWCGVVPATIARGVPYRYRLELELGQGRDGVLSTAKAALLCP
jgi:hypothetical protein